MKHWKWKEMAYASQLILNDNKSDSSVILSSALGMIWCDVFVAWTTLEEKPARTFPN